MTGVWLECFYCGKERYGKPGENLAWFKDRHRCRQLGDRAPVVVIRPARFRWPPGDPGTPRGQVREDGTLMSTREDRPHYWITWYNRAEADNAASYSCKLCSFGTTSGESMALHLAEHALRESGVLGWREDKES